MVLNGVYNEYAIFGSEKEQILIYDSVFSLYGLDKIYIFLKFLGLGGSSGRADCSTQEPSNKSSKGKSSNSRSSASTTTDNSSTGPSSVSDSPYSRTPSSEEDPCALLRQLMEHSCDRAAQVGRIPTLRGGPSRVRTSVNVGSTAAKLHTKKKCNNHRKNYDSCMRFFFPRPPLPPGTSGGSTGA